MRLLWLPLFFFFVPYPLLAAEARVAVASNFSQVARELAARFEARSGHQVRISSASSGKLYAQIRHGAPFHLFLSADAERPRRLVKAGLARPQNRRTYAIGRLVFWAPDHPGDAEVCRARLRHLDRLAVANPRTAPYGAAAVETLKALGRDPGQLRLVVGENIAQAYAFTASGAVEGGLVAAAQIQGRDLTGCRWPVPERLHHPIEQQAVLLEQGEDNPAAEGFFRFLFSEPARTLIQAAGYRLP